MEGVYVDLSVIPLALEQNRLFEMSFKKEVQIGKYCAGMPV